VRRRKRFTGARQYEPFADMPHIKIKFMGLNEFTSQIGNNEFDIQLDGDTFGDLLKYLQNRFGASFRKAVLNDRGEVDNMIQVVKNEDEWLARGNFSSLLEEGDQLLFFLMIAGG